MTAMAETTETDATERAASTIMRLASAQADADAFRRGVVEALERFVSDLVDAEDDAANEAYAREEAEQERAEATEARR